MSKTTKTKEKGAVTIADMIVLLALAIFAIFTYFGLAFKHSMSTCILYVVLYIIILLACIAALKRVKKVENYFSRWIIVEGVLLMVYAIVAINISGPIVNAFSATSQKEILIKAGQSDIANIKSLFDDYEQQEEANINEVIETLRTVNSVELSDNDINKISARLGDDALEKYHRYGKRICAIKEKDVTAYEDLLRQKYLEDGGENELNYLEFKETQIDELEDASRDIDNWNLIKTSFIASDLVSRYDVIAERLTDISGQRHRDNSEVPYKFLVGENSLYEDESKLEVDYTSYKQDLSFSKRFSEIETPVAKALTTIIFILMLIGYFVTQRSTTVGIKGFSKKSRNNDGGISLYE